MKVIIALLVTFLLLSSVSFAQDILVTKVIDQYAAINKGSYNGIKNGQIYSARRLVNNQWRIVGDVRVIEVRANRAAIECVNKRTQLQAGDVLFKPVPAGGLTTPRQGTQNRDISSQSSSNVLSPVGIKRIMIIPFGGVSMPIGEGSDAYKFGFQGGGSVFFNDLIPNFAFGGWAAFNQWMIDKDKFTTGASIPGVSIDVSGGTTIIELMAAARYLIPMSADRSKMLFLNAGFGIYMFKFNLEQTTTIANQTTTSKMDTSTTKPGFAVGAGFLVARAGGIGFQVIALYHTIFTEGSSTNYIAGGVGIVL